MKTNQVSANHTELTGKTYQRGTVKQLDRISKEALEINQRIVRGLQDALAEYKSSELTARLATVLKKYLPESDFYVSMWKEKIFDWYTIQITPVNISRFFNNPDATFRQEREGSSYYAVHLNSQVNKENWREKFQFLIDRFNCIDEWEWEQNREPYLDQFAELERQAMEIKAKADALVASIPKPEHDPLNRFSCKSDYQLQKAFPHAFHYYERR